MNLHSYDGGCVVIWGDGIEGQGARRWFADRAADVTTVVDSSPDLQQTLDRADIIVRSPGVNPRRPELSNRPVTTLTDLWLATPRSAPVIGVTGTKGKSTTTVITTQLLRAAGLNVGMGGNIEIPVTDLRDDCDVYVIEVSSYMASDLTRSPTFGILTNLGDDHLVWHGGVSEYRRDKLNLFAHSELRRLAVNGLDPISMAATSSLERAEFGSNGYTRAATAVSWNDTQIADLAGTALGNAHFALNACAALTASAWVAGTCHHLLADVAATYEPLPSRLQQIACDRGITFIDDALASNPTGALASVTAFDDQPVALIVGGTDRHVEFDEFFAALATRSQPISIIAISDIGPELAALAHGHRLPHSLVPRDDFDTAVARAVEALGSHGGIVLFSPAAATPPAIGNYKQRSAMFGDAVRRVIG